MNHFLVVIGFPYLINQFSLYNDIQIFSRILFVSFSILIISIIQVNKNDIKTIVNIIKSKTANEQ